MAVKKARLTLAFFVGFLLMLNIYAWQEVFDLCVPANLEVYFLDVGQGDSIFIETPQRHQVLIDGGPDASVLQELQKLMPKYDKTLDIVILSHPEKDHLFGILEVLKRYQVDYIMWSGIAHDTPEYQEWVGLLEKSKAKVVIVENKVKITAGDITIDNAMYSDKGNDASVVSRLVFGNNSFLFTGDISSVVENKIENPASNVLKVAHHGSKYSTSDLFLQNVKPSIAVIEVGKNSYGHPTPETLQRLDNFGIKVKRTDIDGTIELVSDSNNIYIK